MDYPNIQNVNSFESFQERRKFQTNFSWAIPTPKAIKSIVDFAAGEVIYEIGAGKGYWAYFINEMGGKIKCFDNPDCVYDYFESPKKNDCGQNIATADELKTFYPVDFCTPKGVVDKCKDANILMFCWPEYDKKWAYEYLKKIQPDKLIYIGEEFGGCCANDDFFKYIEKKYEEYGYTDIPQWYGLHDYLFFFKKNEK